MLDLLQESLQAHRITTQNIVLYFLKLRNRLDLMGSLTKENLQLPNSHKSFIVS